MKKRILSILLAVLMLLSVLPVTAMAADGTTDMPVTMTSGNTDGPKLRKTAQWEDKNAGIAKITMEVWGEPSQQSTEFGPTDIVLVVDCSGSMLGTHIEKAKTAARDFVEQFLGSNGTESSRANVQIGVVTYNKTANRAAELSNSKDELNNKINTINATYDTGTNIQAGIHTAQTMLGEDTRTGVAKYMIVLSDGEPTYSYRFDATADYAGCKSKISSVHTKGHYVNFVFQPNYNKNKIIGSGNKFSIDYNVKLTKAVCTKHNDKLNPNFHTTDFVYNGGVGDAAFTKTSGTNNGVATIWEANQAKANGTTIYSIGFGSEIGTAQNPNNAYKTMVAIASSPDKYKAASESDVSNVFDAIATEIKSYTAYNAVVTDPMGAGFTVIQNDTTYPITVANGETASVDAANGNLVWKVAKELDETKHTITFYIQYNTSTASNNNNPLPTNNGAELTFTTDEEGKVFGTPVTVGNPELPNPSKKVSYDDNVADADLLKPEHADKFYWPGKTVTVAGALTRDGYDFDGWYVGDTRYEGTFTMPSENVMLTAKWTKQKFTVTWMNGTTELEKDENVEYGTEPEYNGNAPTKAADADHTYTFLGWNTDQTATTKLESLPNVTADVTYYAIFSATTIDKYTVTYDANGGIGTVPVDQNSPYVINSEVTILDKGELTKEDHDFAGWNTLANGTGTSYAAGDKIDQLTGNVILYAQWTEKQNPPADKYKVIYKFESGTTGEDLPSEVTTLLPRDDTEYTTGNTVAPVTPSKTEVPVTNGKWEFKGWTPAGEQTFEKSDITFTGTWEFTESQETTYDVSLTITKTVDNVHGTAPAETYEFVVYYYNTNNEKVYLCNASNPLPISLAAGEESKEKDFTIEMTQTQLNNWPETLVREGTYEGRVRFVYVEEIDGGTDHMTYAKTPVRGQFVGIAISSMRSVTKYFLYSEQNWQGIFSFTNVYNKTTGRDVTPAKVSPQLNRDDHVAYIMGYPDGKVRPEGEITRAEACTIFFRLLTKESRDYYFSKTNDYTDVSRTDWFNNAISTLSNAGIVTGYADGTFRPDQPITRGEMAKIIANFARLGGATKSFTDLSGHWAKSYVELAAGNGWIAGYPDGTFGPDKKITRAETVTMINRVLERVPAKESRLLSRSIMLTFPDNEPGEWYYIAVQEASNSHTYQRSAYETAGDEMWLRLIENVDWTKLEK